MNGQLILADETLRVINSVLPYSKTCDEIARARNTYSGGHLTTAEVREIDRALKAAGSDPARLVTAEALKAAVEDLQAALRRVDLDGLELAGQRTVSLFVWDPARDSPASLEAAHAPL